MADEAVLTEADGGVLLITLNRPDARNAVNAALADGLAAALDRLDDDDELRVGILTGAGKGFCAGMDLKAFVAGREPVRRAPRLRRASSRARRASRSSRRRGLRGRRRLRGRARLRPDRRRARREARHPRGQALAGRRRRRAAAPAAAASPTTWRWSWRSPASRSRAERGAELGLVNRLTEPGEAVAGARELAAAIAANGPLALDGLQAHPRRGAGLARGRGVAAPGRDLRPGLRLRGRARGRHRLRREARPGLARAC